MRKVEEVEHARQAAETHAAVSRVVQHRAITEIERQGDRGGFIARLMMRGETILDLTKDTLERTK